MTILTKEQFDLLVSERGLLNDKIQKYWILQALRKYYEQASFLPDNRKQQILAEFDKLSQLICDEILGSQFKQ